jgi:NAD(P)-dependent dehydrogenase (short-subunit alcohol dehydrogenase family)
MGEGWGHRFDDLLDQTIVLSYSKIGYIWRQRRWNPADLQVDLSGKVCLVTGANAGLGYATCQQLAQRGASVYMLVRSRRKGEAAQAALIRATGNRNIHLEIADLSSQADIRAFVARFRQREERLDVLVNNAGVLLAERQESVDGLELTFATNVLGTFLLTQLLFPLLQQSAPARVVVVSSGGMYGRKLNVADLQFSREPYSGVLAYAQTKRAQVILTELWAQQWPDRRVTVNAMHPGWVRTPGLQSSLPLFSKIMNVILRSPDQGVDTIVWLALAPHLAGESGQFWFDRRVRPTHKTKRTQSSAEDRQKFWAECVRLCSR